MNNQTVSVVGVGAIFVAIVASLVLAFGSWTTVSPGHRGVVIRMGSVQPIVLNEGFNWKRPWMDDIEEVEVRTQMERVNATAASKDMQMVDAVIALNISVIPNDSSRVFQTIGRDYMSKVVVPATQEVIKSETAKFTAESLLTQRDMVRSGMMAQLKERLNPLGFTLEAVNIVDFNFSPAFNAAIEAKVTAEQNALAAKNQLAQKEFEAQQAVATAKGKAESMEVEAKAMKENPQILSLRALEKWDGTLPRLLVLGQQSGLTPILDITPLIPTK